MRKLLVFSVAILMSASVLAASEIYRWKDANGNWHFSDQPQPGAELVRGSRPATPAAPPAPPAPPPQTVASSNTSPVSDAVAREVREQAAAHRNEVCKQAEENYQQSLRALRIHREDEQGNRTYLTEAEADAYRLEARGNRDLACRT